MDAPEAAEHRQSRCSAIESLQAVFRWEHQFAVKMALPGKMPEALILRPQIDRGSGFQPLLGPAKPVLRIADERAKALSYFPGGYRQSGRARGRLLLLWRFFCAFRAFPPASPMLRRKKIHAMKPLPLIGARGASKSYPSMPHHHFFGINITILVPPPLRGSISNVPLHTIFKRSRMFASAICGSSSFGCM